MLEKKRAKGYYTGKKHSNYACSFNKLVVQNFPSHVDMRTDWYTFKTIYNFSSFLFNIISSLSFVVCYYIS